MEMFRGATRRRRKTGAPAACLEGAPAPCHPALRFSRIIGQLLRARVAQATLALGLRDFANPTIDARRVPKRSRYGRRLRLVVGIDLTYGALDLERVERACARGYLFRAHHLGLAGDAQCGPTLKMRGLALETPRLADLEWCSDTRAIRWPVLPDAVIDAVPASVEDDLMRACRAPH